MSRTKIRDTEKEERRALLYGPILANAVDAASTAYALKNNPRAIEANPLMESMSEHPNAMMASKLAGGVLTGLLARKLHKDGHHTAAKIAGSVSIGLPLAAAVSNIIQARKKG